MMSFDDADSLGLRVLLRRFARRMLALRVLPRRSARRMLVLRVLLLRFATRTLALRVLLRRAACGQVRVYPHPGGSARSDLLTLAAGRPVYRQGSAKTSEISATDPPRRRIIPSETRSLLHKDSRSKESHSPLALLNSCLLYTSPSPRDYAASRMPSSA